MIAAFLADNSDLTSNLGAARTQMALSLGFHIVLSCFGSEIAFPRSTIPALTHLLAAGPDGVAVGDLPGDLDAEERLVLVRRLVREGAVEARW